MRNLLSSGCIAITILLGAYREVIGMDELPEKIKLWIDNRIDLWRVGTRSVISPEATASMRRNLQDMYLAGWNDCALFESKRNAFLKGNKI